MKIHNLIKADFFINPENYGVFVGDDLQGIWDSVIKPIIPEIDIVSKIDNSFIKDFIKSYRQSVRDMI